MVPGLLETDVYLGGDEITFSSGIFTESCSLALSCILFNNGFLFSLGFKALSVVLNFMCFITVSSVLLLCFINKREMWHCAAGLSVLA